MTLSSSPIAHARLQYSELLRCNDFNFETYVVLYLKEKALEVEVLVEDRSSVVRVL